MTDSHVVLLSSPEAVNADRFGPKAANQAALGQAGLPIPDGFCISADAYRAQLKSAGLDKKMIEFGKADFESARSIAIDLRIELYDGEMDPALKDEILTARQSLIDRTGEMMVVRSSALVEDREGSSFAGQFESFLGLETEDDFITAVRACWAALWSVRALRYMDGHDISAGDTAMGLLVQPLVTAIASGGGLSQMAAGGMKINATWGLGEAIAQGEVVPDSYEISENMEIIGMNLGRKSHRIGCEHHGSSNLHKSTEEEVNEHCLSEAQVLELAGYLKKSAELIKMPAEIEWALDDKGFKLLQVRPLQVNAPKAPDKTWRRHPGIQGQPSGTGVAEGKACVINCECELSRVAPGDILITTVAGPSLSQILPRVSGVVAELGGSTSHLASLARERGIPTVLGVQDATTVIPDGAQVSVDGTGGIVRWIGGEETGRMNFAP
jgi:pyruvate,water dikinase